jgi:hypothetical protein
MPVSLTGWWGGGAFMINNTNTSGSGVDGTGGGVGVAGWGGTWGMWAEGNAGIAAIADGGDGWYAGSFTGNVYVNGTLSKTAGSFKIDHPLDPANKYLYHSFVESPDMKNIYDGVAVLDSNGEAVVQLPDWFQALNRDFRYQLTAVGAPGPNLYIAEEVSSNQFKIAGGAAGLKVSWQVTGIRQDAYANAHRIPVEEIKPAGERGLYLHPELFGQPAEKKIGPKLPPNTPSAPAPLKPATAPTSAQINDANAGSPVASRGS